MGSKLLKEIVLGLRLHFLLFCSLEIWPNCKVWKYFLAQKFVWKYSQIGEHVRISEHH